MTVDPPTGHAVMYRPGAARWSAFLLAWALTGALGLVDLVAIRQTVIVVLVTLSVSPATLGLVDKSRAGRQVPPCGAGARLAWRRVMYAQHVYSQAGGKGAGWRPLLTHFRRVTMVELLVLAAAVGIPLGFVGATHLP